MDTYLAELRRASDELRGFTRHNLKALNFINRAAQFASVEYSAVSALGSNPQDGRLVAKIAPRRVLDPLLWAIGKSMAESARTWEAR